MTECVVVLCTHTSPCVHAAVTRLASQASPLPCAQGEWDEGEHGRLPSGLGAGLVRFLKGILCAALWMQLGKRFSASLLESVFWTTLSVPRRMALIWVIGFAARLKYYFVWSVAESGLILSGQCFAGKTQKVRFLVVWCAI